MSTPSGTLVRDKGADVNGKEIARQAADLGHTASLRRPRRGGCRTSCTCGWESRTYELEAAAITAAANHVAKVVADGVSVPAGVRPSL